MRKPPRTRKSHAERFYLHVEKMPGEGACWLWRGAIRKRGGYGLFRVEKEIMPAHKFAWILEHGAVPSPDKLVAHTCTNVTCVRPDHLLAKKRQGLVWTHGRGNFRIDNDQVREMRDAHAAGESLSSIARRFGSAWDHVSGIVKWERRKTVHETKCGVRGAIKTGCTCRANNQPQGENDENSPPGKLVSET